MKHIKLFENYEVDRMEYPKDGHNLSPREEKILKDLVGDYYLYFRIKKDDGYYYTYTMDLGFYCNRFYSFNDLKNYIQFRNLISKNYPNSFLELLKVSKLDMSFNDNWPIRWASEKGHTQVVKLLLEDPRVDPSDKDNYAIRLASKNGNTEIVEILLKDPRVDPSADSNWAIRNAPYLEIFKLLLEDPRVDPSDQDNYTIRLASYFGKEEVVKLLLKDPRVDPTAVNNWAIRHASENGHKEVVRILLADTRVRSKLSSKKINKYLDEIS